jgi:CP family cyanate transporter-like MFS transporter
VWSLTFFSIVLGIGQGGAFGVALLLFALRTEDPHTGAQLSALAQTVGYIAGGLIGPFAVGVIYEWSASWVVVEVFYVAVGAASLVCGLGAGRALTVAAKSRPSRGP